MTDSMHLIALIAAGLACVGLAACGAGDETQRDGDQAGTVEPQIADLERNYPQGAYVFQCGDTEAAVIYDDTTGLELVVGEAEYALTNTGSEAATRYTLPGDASTAFEMRGETASLTLEGEELPECVLEREPI